MQIGLIVYMCVISLLDYTSAIECPHKCVCSRSRVDCAQKGLVTIPRGIPRNVKKL